MSKCSTDVLTIRKIDAFGLDDNVVEAHLYEGKMCVTGVLLYIQCTVLSVSVNRDELKVNRIKIQQNQRDKTGEE